MGSVFRYIADSALTPEDASYYTKCHVCDKPQVPVFSAQGEVVREDGTVDDLIAVACEPCLKTGKIIHISEWKTDLVIRAYLRRYFTDKGPAFIERRSQELFLALRKTPRVPMFMKGDDWPLCCGDLTEFKGSPKDVNELPNVDGPMIYWSEGVKEPVADFKSDGPPESLYEVSFFECLSCDKRYWIFQFT